MLIIGGLVAVGVIALIGAILLALGEGRGASAATQVPTQTISAAPQTSASAPQAETQQVEDTRSTPETRDARPEPVLEAPSPVYSNGQFHEAVIQLQMLHEQSKDLQARLGQLSEIVEHMEQRESDMLELSRARRVS
jgi:hypothetical protein